jgi:hypothetical protein
MFRITTVESMFTDWCNRADWRSRREFVVSP